MGNYQYNGYHRSPFKYRNVTNEPGELYGVELEMEHDNSREALLDSIPDQENEKLRPVTEMDGSLNGTGVEIIFPPLKVSQISRKNSFFRRTLQALKDGGAATSTRTGMHVNINTHGWGDRLIDSFIAFHQTIPNDIYKKIGGRNLNRFCGIAYYNRDFPLDYLGASVVNSHGTVVSKRIGRVELRYPEASLDHNRLLLVISFSRLVRDYLKHEIVPRLPPRNPSVRDVIGDVPADALEGFRQYVMKQKTTDAKRVKEAIFDAKPSSKTAKPAVIKRPRAA